MVSVNKGYCDEGVDKNVLLMVALHSSSAAYVVIMNRRVVLILAGCMLDNHGASLMMWDRLAWFMIMIAITKKQRITRILLMCMVVVIYLYIHINNLMRGGRDDVPTSLLWGCCVASET